MLTSKLIEFELKHKQSKHSSNEDVQRFFVVGDFGDLDSKENIDHMTNIMDHLSEKQTYDFIATVGDNLYPNGIESMDNLENISSVMEFFQKSNTKDLPMYLTLGNHDCYVDYQNEIKYSEVNEQWNMESDYYEKRFPLKDDPSKSFVLLMANSCLLACKTKFKGEGVNSKANCDEMNVKVDGNRVNDHYFWLEEKLRRYSDSSDVAWLAVAFHHPILGEASMKKDLLPLFQKYKVDMAIVGHSHMFQYSNIGYDEEVKYPGKNHGPILDDCKDKTEILNTATRSQVFNKGDKLHQFLIGGSGRVFADICPYKDQDGEIYFQNIVKYGLASVEVDSKHFNLKYYNDIDSVIYEVTINS